MVNDMQQECKPVCPAHESMERRVERIEDSTARMAEHVGNIRADVAAIKEFAVLLKDKDVVDRLSALEGIKKMVVWVLGLIGTAAAALVAAMKG